MIDNRTPDHLERQVTSRDSTSIAFDQQGDGPVVILVAAALSDRSDTAKLAGLLARRFTVINYDRRRRGRGRSGDTQPYAIEREIEDLEALVDAAGGSAYMFGSSAGAVLALRAASSGVNITKLALYEPPLRLDDRGTTPTLESAAHVGELVAAGRRGDAVTYFMTNDVGVPAPMLLLMRLLTRGMWAKMASMAHTLRYDYAVVEQAVRDTPLAALEWVSVTAPMLVMDGGKSPAHLRRPAEAVAGVVPGAEHRTLPGQNHGAVLMAPKVVAAALVDFFQA